MLLTSTELRNELQITQPMLTAWIHEGLPWEGTAKKKLFDEHAVAQWLVDHGKVRTTRQPATISQGPTCTTREEAARELGIAPRTLATWCTMDGFPGRPGSRGRREGHYPIAEIKEWHAQTFPESTWSAVPTNPFRQRRENAQAEMAEMDLAERKGELIRLEDVIRFYTRQMAQAKAILDDMPDIVLSILPTTKIKRDERERIRSRLDEVRDQVLEQFVELLKGDTDPTDED